MRTIPLKSSPEHFTRQWVHVLSSFLDLTPAEEKALVVILSVTEINHYNRKGLAKQLKLTPSGFNNHVMTLAKKQILLRQEDGRYLINPTIVPDPGGIQFLFVNAAG